MQALFNRREVIKTLLVSSATSLIGNNLWAAKAVSEIAPSIDPTIGMARFAVSSFPGLSYDGGSVRIGFFGRTLDSAEMKPIIINRITVDEYVALDTECTHRGCVVDTLNPFDGVLICPCHGSQYDIRGIVVRGPAPFSLGTYDTHLANGILTVELLDCGFTVSQTLVLDGTQQRLQLSAMTRVGFEYEVRYTSDLNTLPTAIPFAQTLAGAPSNAALVGNGSLKSAYVVPQNGLYQLAYRMTLV